MRRRVLFYVQHLLGIGHLRRAEALTAAMAEAGLDVTVALGSKKLPEVPFAAAHVEQLPPARIEGENFSVLIDEKGRRVDQPWKDKRRDLLLEVLRRTDPDVVLVELFPFGRRQFRFELIPLLDAIHGVKPRPQVVSSVRDILVAPTKPGRAEQAADLVRRFFDRVLVHGDPRLIAFDATFPAAAKIADLIRYTGYVTAPAGPARAAGGRGEVIVSVGGGATGAPLITAALAARPLTRAKHLLWRFLTGPDLPNAQFDMLAKQADRNTAVERFRPDLPALLATCALSVSRGGYNTTMDILAAGAPAVVVPFETREETEQRLRSDLLAERGYLTVLPPDELSPARLAEAIESAMSRPRRERSDLDLNGAPETARIVSELARSRR